MPRTNGTLEVSEFSRGRIVGHKKIGLGQRKISERISIPISTVNRAVVNFNSE